MLVLFFQIQTCQSLIWKLVGICLKNVKIKINDSVSTHQPIQDVTDKIIVSI